MTFDDPEVVELGMAEELVRDDLHFENTEGTMPEKIKTFSAIYIAESE